MTRLRLAARPRFGPGSSPRPIRRRRRVP